MDKFKINYVIASWSGLRREDEYTQIDEYVKPYLIRHLKLLRELKLRHISQITIGYPLNKREDKAYTSFVKSIKDINGIPVVVVPFRKNQGYSYRQYSKIYDAFKKDDFDFYMLIEDDIIPCIENFDTVLLQQYKHLLSDGPLFARNCGWRYGGKHACVSTCFCASPILEDVRMKFGDIPWNDTYFNREMSEQEAFSHAFIDAGHDINDMNLHACPFFESSYSLIEDDELTKLLNARVKRIKDDLIFPIRYDSRILELNLACELPLFVPMQMIRRSWNDTFI